MSDYLAKKELHPWSLAFISISTILGSGWLLAPAFVFSQAGSYSIYAWIIAFLMVLLIALCFAEVCSMVPRDGSTIVLPRVTHGYFVSSMFGFLGWLSWLALIPIESQATIQYLSHFYPSLVHADSSLSVHGTLAAIVTVISITMINYFSIKWVNWLNKYLFTFLKIGIPLCVVIYGYYISTHIPVTKIVPYKSFTGMFSAIPLGIVFAFNGFKSVCESAGRAKNPAYAIPFSILVSLSICLLIYILLQFAYDANATASLTKNMISPFAYMIYQTKTPMVNVMIVVLYVGAISSPYVANIFNLSSGNACAYRVAKFRYVPGVFKNKNRFKSYYIALLTNSAIALLIVLFLNKGWGQMVNNLTSIMVVTYTVGPLCLLALRYQHPEFVRSFKLPFGLLIAGLGFIVANFMVYWCGWQTIQYFLGAVVIGAIIIVVYALIRRQKIPFDFYHSLWMWAWFVGMGVISYYGSYGHGRGDLSGLAACVVIFLFSLIIMFWSIVSRLTTEQSNEELKQLDESISTITGK